MSSAHDQDLPRVMDHFLNPRHVGDVEGADGVGEVGAVACSDVLRLSLRVRDGRIAEARFRAYGCGAAIACGSVTTELILGRTLDEALRVTNQDVHRALGGELPPSKAHCPVLAEEAIRAAVQDCRSRPGRG